MLWFLLIVMKNEHKNTRNSNNLTGFETFWIFDSPPIYKSTFTVFGFGKVIFQGLTTLLEYNQKKLIV